MPRRIGLTLDQWPAADRAAWERTTAPNDVFDTAAIAARWRDKTRAQARYAYARWLTYLRDGEPNALELPPAERLTPDRLEQYTLRLRQRLCEMSIAADLQHLSLALRAIAPDIDWSWLRQRQYAVQKRARPREKRHKIVDPRRLVVLGNELMATAETQERRLEQARRYRDGLLIALLATRPLRRRSLAAIEVGRHLQRVGMHYVIELAEDDTKTRQRRRIRCSRHLDVVHRCVPDALPSDVPRCRHDRCAMAINEGRTAWRRSYLRPCVPSYRRGVRDLDSPAPLSRHRGDRHRARSAGGACGRRRPPYTLQVGNHAKALLARQHG